MTSVSSEVVPELGEWTRHDRDSTLSIDAAIWLLLIPCAVLSLAALLVLGPPLGALLYPKGGQIGFWHPDELHPEPTEQGRYLILCLAPLLLAGATIAATRRPAGLRRIPPRVRWGVIALAQALIVAFIAICWAGQYKPSPGIIYFTPATLITSAGIAALLALVIKSRSAYARCAALLRESRSSHAGALMAATGITAIWLLHAINSDASIGWANSITRYHMAFPFDEAFAVINGLTPLVDFSAQYGSLWPYLSALSMSVFGKTLLVFTITMCAVSGLSLLAVFGVLRRVTRSSTAALLLYVPLLATSCFIVIGGTYVDRHTFVSYFAMFPLRYAGPYLLAWLTARHLDRHPEARTWPLFLVAGVVMLNNTEFGIAGLGGTIAAVLWTMREIRLRTLLRLAINIAVGLLAAFTIVAAITLLRAGELPQLDRLVQFARIYLVGGFGLIPMPRTFGFHVIVYMTYVAAIAAATVQALRQDANRVLTGMLAWSGVFGLGAASYYVGRSSDDTLPSVFSAWALAVALLTVVAIQRTAAKRLRLPGPALLATLYAMGIITCSLAQVPWPWTQLDRIRLSGNQTAQSYPPYMPPMEAEAREFVSSIADGPDRFVVRRGAPVAIFATTGHRIADAYGVRDVVPTTGAESIHTLEQFNEALDALRRAGGNTVLLPGSGSAEMRRILSQRGFKVLTQRGLRTWRGSEADLHMSGDLSKWVDTRRLHPAALR